MPTLLRRLTTRAAAVLAAGLFIALALIGASASTAGAATALPGSAVASVAGAAVAPVGLEPTAPLPDPGGAGGTAGPSGPRGPQGQTDQQDVNINLGGLTNKPSTPVVTILLLTLVSLAPAILLTCTSFTKILVVLSLTRNALGLQQTPPNQVLAGLALFLSMFIMAPVLMAINDAGLQPYLNGDKTASVAFTDGIEPLRDFMLDHTDDDELQLLTSVANRDLPANRDEVSTATLIPAFILTEMKQAFIIGFVIFVPFLVIDIVVSGALMALGMMMMPPSVVSLPFKLLLFVLVDGWALIIRSLVASYNT